MCLFPARSIDPISFIIQDRKYEQKLGICVTGLYLVYVNYYFEEWKICLAIYRQEQNRNKTAQLQ